MLATEVLARTLKHALAHPRPAATCARLALCHSHGMPSSHTAMAFAYLALTTCAAARAASARSALANCLSATEQLAVAAAAASVAASRVYLGYHSPDQVAAGALLGGVLGVLWYVGLAACAPLFERLAATPLAAALGAVDTWGEGGVELAAGSTSASTRVVAKRASSKQA